MRNMQQHAVGKTHMLYYNVNLRERQRIAGDDFVHNAIFLTSSARAGGKAEQAIFFL